MAITIILISSTIGMLASVVALFVFGTSFSFALSVYLVASIGPVVLVLAASYLHMLGNRSISARDTPMAAHRSHR